jgi:hypothetical protein
LNEVHLTTPVTLLIEGGASGADRLAGQWAAEHDVPTLRMNADWKKYGRGAGHIRNQQMLDEKPELLVAFPGGKGTADMVRRARKAGLPVILVEASDDAPVERENDE